MHLRFNVGCVGSQGEVGKDGHQPTDHNDKLNYKCTGVRKSHILCPMFCRLINQY